MDGFEQNAQRQARIAGVAADILDEARVQLMVRFRFLDLALWRMEGEPFPLGRGHSLGTDGAKLYYDPDLLIMEFQESFDEVVRDYLHLLMHCIFRHPFDKAHGLTEAWWLACNVVAESAAMDLCGKRFPSADDAARRQALSELRLACGTLTPGRLYGLFEKVLKAPHGVGCQGLNHQRLNELADLFERDNHEPWPSYAQGQAQEEPGDVQELPTPDDEPQEGDREGEAPELMASAQEQGKPDETPQRSGDGNEAEEGQEDSSATDEAAAEARATAEEEACSSADDGRGRRAESPEEGDEPRPEEREWEEIAKQVEMDLQTFSKEWGDQAGGLIAYLKAANRPRYDYSEFLRRFAMLSEEMKVNDDEYDYIFYTYGLKLYGNMPLIEPLEYKETQRIRDFVIAIDTSESCQGDLVRRFLTHTFSLLKSQEDFAHDVNIHIIQCDAKVQADTRIRDLRDIDGFMEGFHVRGMGGTDFRPVFGYVDDLRTQGELQDLKGLIYFTDGLGSFPQAAPDYDCAFIFMDDGSAALPSVPPWAMKVVLDEEGLEGLGT